jgi:hypothetical protein
MDAKTVTDKIKSMLDEDASLKMDLLERILQVQKMALNAGMILNQLIYEQQDA